MLSITQCKRLLKQDTPLVMQIIACQQKKFSHNQILTYSNIRTSKSNEAIIGYQEKTYYNHY